MLLATAKSIHDQMPAELPPNASVALLLEKDGVLVAAAIAVLLAGCAYIPIDAEKTPLARVHDILCCGRGAGHCAKEPACCEHTRGGAGQSRGR